MKFWVLTALILGLSAALAVTAADAGPCGPKRARNCVDPSGGVSFSTVPDISRKIVSEEPAAEKPSTHTLEAPPITTYTGPTVGVSMMARAPTVGYYWSLEQ
jgi:hypothetical protein